MERLFPIKARNRSGQPDSTWPDFDLNGIDLKPDNYASGQPDINLKPESIKQVRSTRSGFRLTWKFTQMFSSTWNLTWTELNWLRLSGFRLISGWPEMDQVRSGFFYKITWPDLNFQVGLFLTWFRPRSTCSEPYPKHIFHRNWTWLNIKHGLGVVYCLYVGGLRWAGWAL